MPYSAESSDRKYIAADRWGPIRRSGMISLGEGVYGLDGPRAAATAVMHLYIVGRNAIGDVNENVY